MKSENTGSDTYIQQQTLELTRSRLCHTRVSCANWVSLTETSDLLGHTLSGVPEIYGLCTG